MTHRDTDNSLEGLMDAYISIEKEILRRIRRFSQGYCFQCAATCCRETYCREALESSFLHHLVTLQKIDYDGDRGWLATQGCRLEYGRPPVCYEFFCRKISMDQQFKNTGLEEMIRAFITSGNRASGGNHLICVADLSRIPSLKIAKIRRHLEALLEKSNPTLTFFSNHH